MLCFSHTSKTVQDKSYSQCSLQSSSDNHCLHKVPVFVLLDAVGNMGSQKLEVNFWRAHCEASARGANC